MWRKIQWAYDSLSHTDLTFLYVLNVRMSKLLLYFVCNRNKNICQPSVQSYHKSFNSAQYAQHRSVLICYISQHTIMHRLAFSRTALLDLMPGRFMLTAVTICSHCYRIQLVL